MPTMTMSHIGIISDPELLEFIKPLQQSLGLSLEKAAANLKQPALYPMPTDEFAVEQIISKRIKTYPKEKQEAAVKTYDLLAAETTLLRTQRLGEFAQINLKSPVSVSIQALNVIRNHPPKFDLARITTLAANIGEAVARSSETILEGNANRTMDFIIDEVYCRDETNPEWTGEDEISLGGTAVDSTASAIKIPKFDVGDFDDGDRKKYLPGKKLISFDLIKQLMWPQTFTMTLVLAEVDMGGLAEYIEALLKAIKKEVQEYIAVTVGATVGAYIGSYIPIPGLGTLIGAAVGALVGWLIGEIGKAVHDDIFKPNTASITIPHANAAWPGTGLISPKAKLEFDGNGGAYEVFYNWRLHRDLEGQIAVLQGRSGGIFKDVIKREGMIPTWGRIIPGKFTAQGQSLLFYDSSNGRGEFHQLDTTEGTELIKAHDNWRKTWTAIVAGKFSSSPLSDLMFYDANDGTIAFYKTLGEGSIKLIKELKQIRPSWLILVPGFFTEDQLTDLMFYDPVLGEIELYRSDGNGNLSLLKKHSNQRHTWSIISYSTESNPNRVFFYDAENGEAELYLTHGQGDMFKWREYKNLAHDWTQIIPGKFGGSDHYGDWLFYNLEKGLVSTYEMEFSGELKQINSIEGIAWKGLAGTLVPIEFSGAGYTDLLRYKVAKPPRKIAILGPTTIYYSSDSQWAEPVHLSSNLAEMTPPLSIEWTVEKGTPVFSSDKASITLTKLTEGTYRIRLTVQDSLGETGIASHQLRVIRKTGITPP